MLPVPTRELRCSNCGSVNRVDAYGIDKLPQCGKCQVGMPESVGKRTCGGSMRPDAPS